MPFQCAICGEESTRICARCTKDTCNNHLCERCARCSDCCDCEVALTEVVHEPVRAMLRNNSAPEPPLPEPEPPLPEPGDPNPEPDPFPSPEILPEGSAGEPAV